MFGITQTKNVQKVNHKKSNSMKKTIKQSIWLLSGFLLVVLASAFGLSSAVMAMATPLEGGGVGAEGAATVEGIQKDSPELFEKEIDQRIVKIRPSSTPIDQISRSADSQPSASMVVKYYSVGTRPIKTTLSAAVEAQTSGSSMLIQVSDSGMFSEDDTIRVVGVKGKKGAANDATREDLVLHVKGMDENSGQPIVYAVNGAYDSNSKQNILLPAISEGAVLIRLGKACGELNMQTAAFNNLPTPEEQYCQNFMMQVEESTFAEMQKKEVDWNFSDLEEDGIYDMRLGMEGSFLFGYKAQINHPTNKKGGLWFTGGIWWQAAKDVEVGTYSAEAGSVISEDDLVDFAKQMFVGTDTGNKRKILLCGSDLLASLSKCRSNKFKIVENVEAWSMKFKSFDTEFGEILVMHDEMFNLHGMPDKGLCFDPVYLTKKKFITWTRYALDLKKTGVRNTNAVVLQEASCLYLRYPSAHARVALKKA